MKKKLFVDDVRIPVDIYPDTDMGDWLSARTYETAIYLLETEDIELISLDHDLGADKSGYDLCKWMSANNRWPQYVQIHSMNPVGRINMLREYEFYLKHSK